MLRLVSCALGSQLFSTRSLTFLLLRVSCVDIYYPTRLSTGRRALLNRRPLAQGNRENHAGRVHFASGKKKVKNWFHSDSLGLIE